MHKNSRSVQLSEFGDETVAINLKDEGCKRHRNLNRIDRLWIFIVFLSNCK